MSTRRVAAGDAWPDPAVGAATRARRRRLVRRVLGASAAVGVLWACWSLGLIDGRGVVLVVALVIGVVSVRLLAASEGSGRAGPFERAVMKPSASPTSNRLTEIERSLDLATISAGDAHHFLRPLVVDIAGTWLQGAHGIGLADAGSAALLPPAVWAVVSPGTGRPADPHGPGVTLAELSALVAELERLA